MARKPKATDQSTDAAVPDAITDQVDTYLMAMVDATDPETKAVEPDPVTPPAAPTPTFVPDAQAKEQPPSPVQAKGRSGGGVFIGMVLGAGIAAAAGIGVMRYAPDLIGVPQVGLPEQLSVDVTDLRTDLDALRATVDGMAKGNTQRDNLLQGQVDDLTARLGAGSGDAGGTAALEARLTAIESRLNALADASAGGSAPASADVQALRDQIAALQTGIAPSEQAVALAAEAEQRLTEARDAAAALTAETKAATAATLRQAALARVSAALDNGAPFAGALADLGADIPAPLADVAATGVPSLTALQDGFPDAARRALEAAINADMGASWTERVGNFLRNQTGARSLTPRDGDDPDAILSRAESALAGGDLAATLAELATLPDPAKAALADWVAQADQRQQAVQALTALAAQG